VERTQPGVGDAERGLITRRGGASAALPDAAPGRRACIYPCDSRRASAAGLGGKKGLKTHPSFTRQLRRRGGGGEGKNNGERMKSWEKRGGWLPCPQ